MFGLNDLSIDFLTAYPWLVWPALTVLIAMGVWSYYRTNPPLPRWLRIVLGCLRVVALLAVFAMLLEPVVRFSRSHERPRRVALVLDRSASMDRVENGLSRRARLDSLLSSTAFEHLADRVDIKTHYFGGNLTREEAAVDREKTSLGESVYELSRQEMVDPSDYWLLMTDGRSNAGRKPQGVAGSVRTPVVAIDLSAATGNFDVGLADVEFNPVVFAGQPTDVQVKLRWQDGGEKTVQVGLFDGDAVLAQRSLPLTADDGLGDVELSYVPAQPGQRLLKVRVSPLEGEESTDNNEQSLAVKILKSRLLVLLVSDSPDYEVAFLKRFLDRSDKYEVDFVATGSKSGNLAGRFPTAQSDLNRYDLIVLHDPEPGYLSNRRDVISSYLADRGGALWVLMGNDFARSTPVAWFNDLLPFHLSARGSVVYGEFHAEPVEGNLFHPVVRLADDQSSIRNVWANLPPFKSLVVCDETDPAAVVLAHAPRNMGGGERPPVLGFRRNGPGKVMASAVMPFWTWGFANLGFGEDAAGYDRFLEGAVSWLTVRDDFDPIRISPEKEVFTRGETIRFEGYAFDQGFRPLPGVRGVVKLTPAAEGNPLEIDLEDKVGGRFVAEFYNMPPDRYRYEASFNKEGRLLKDFQGNILIEAFSLEEFDQSGDPDALRAVAGKSGGGYFVAADFDRAVESLELSPVAVTTPHDLALFGRFWLLLIFISAISLEWLLRKMNQLI